MHCVEPFYCVDEWMLAKCRFVDNLINTTILVFDSLPLKFALVARYYICYTNLLSLDCLIMLIYQKSICFLCKLIAFLLLRRCLNGYIESEDGKNCTKASELCRTNPCLCYRDNPSGSRHRNAGQINDSAKLSRLLSSSESNSEICPDCDLFKYSPDAECDGEDGEKTDQHRNPTTVNARIFKLEYGLFFIVIIALVPLNIPCKFIVSEYLYATNTLHLASMQLSCFCYYFIVILLNRYKIKSILIVVFS